jgi:hypothetical protein
MIFNLCLYLLPAATFLALRWCLVLLACTFETPCSSGITIVGITDSSEVLLLVSEKGHEIHPVLTVSHSKYSVLVLVPNRDQGADDTPEVLFTGPRGLLIEAPAVFLYVSTWPEILMMSQIRGTANTTRGRALHTRFDAITAKWSR